MSKDPRQKIKWLRTHSRGVSVEIGHIYIRGDANLTRSVMRTTKGQVMRKLHLVNNQNPHRPFCAARIDMIRNGFETTENEAEVTCSLCKMRLGLIEDTRGNWDNRVR